MKKLSIIIVTHNSEGDIYDCIGSIYKFADLPVDDFEIIVVDNNSEAADIMFAKLRATYGNNIILINNNVNGGYGQGNNIGLEKASAPVALIINPDVRLMEPVFKTALQAFEDDVTIGIYGMKQMLSETKLSTNSFSCTYMMNGYLRVVMTSLCNRYNIFLPKIMYLSGSCFFVRVNALRKAGMFDESVFMYGEEDDVRFRMSQIGQKARFNKNLRYIHLVETRVPNLAYQKRMLASTTLLNEKKGYSRKYTTRNVLRGVLLLLLRERLRKLVGKDNKPLIAMLTEYKDYLRSLL